MPGSIPHRRTLRKRLLVGGCTAGAVLAFAPAGGAVIHPDPGSVVEGTHARLQVVHPDPGNVIEAKHAKVIRPMPGRITGARQGAL
jgi:hypothetical protein